MERSEIGISPVDCSRTTLGDAKKP